MKYSELAKNVKELRNQKNYSQEELAEISQLSLRTIQRIESGETIPRGYTLKRLAKAFDLSSNELLGEPVHEEANHVQEHGGYLMLLNLSALSFLLFPILGIVLPLIVWKSHKSNIENLNESGKQLLNFQISWCIVHFIIFIVIAASIVVETERGAGVPVDKLIIAALCMGALYLYYIFLIVYNTVRSMSSNESSYSPSIKFFK